MDPQGVPQKSRVRTVTREKEACPDSLAAWHEEVRAETGSRAAPYPLLYIR
eukprot:COSAG03_NODE_18754_length_349_cov_0.828000_1_plen_50_part_10